MLTSARTCGNTTTLPLYVIGCVVQQQLHQHHQVMTRQTRRCVNALVTLVDISEKFPRGVKTKGPNAANNHVYKERHFWINTVPNVTDWFENSRTVSALSRTVTIQKTKMSRCRHVNLLWLVKQMLVVIGTTMILLFFSTTAAPVPASAVDHQVIIITRYTVDY